MKILNRYNQEVIVEKDVETIKELVEYAIEEGISLCEANLYEADLRGADLREADLCEAILYKANLYKADLCGAILYKADLREAILYKANLCGADLCGADLCGANLYKADLRGASGIRIFTAGENNRLCYTYIYQGEQRFQLGCFNGSFKETVEAIRKKYGNDSMYEKIVTAYKVNDGNEI